MKVIINKPRPLFRRQLKTGPAHPLGNRVLVREFPVESRSEAGLFKPDEAKEHYYAGTVIGAGDQAADKLYDLGVELGDEVWYAKYAGLLQEWSHIVGRDNRECPHDGAWEFVPNTETKKWGALGEPNENTKLRECRACGTLRLTERVIVMSVEDLCLDVDLLVRLETGEMVRKRGADDRGRTRYFIERQFPDDHVSDLYQAFGEARA